MSVTSTIVQYNDREEGSERIITLVLDMLDKKTQELSKELATHAVSFDEDAQRPWALVIVKDDQITKDAMTKRFYQTPESRKWMDSIQICRTDAVNQLKSILCSLHVPAKDQKTNPGQPDSILDWIEYEKHGQPPSIVVVVDIFDYLIKVDPVEHEQVDSQLQYLSISFDQLGSILACLLESCIYESTQGQRFWQDTLGVNMCHQVDLVISDHGKLPKPSEVQYKDATQQDRASKLYQLLSYYLDHVLF